MKFNVGCFCIRRWDDELFSGMQCVCDSQDGMVKKSHSLFWEALETLLVVLLVYRPRSERQMK